MAIKAHTGEDVYIIVIINIRVVKQSWFVINNAVLEDIGTIDNKYKYDLAAVLSNAD